MPPPPAGHKWKEVRHDNEVGGRAETADLDSETTIRLPVLCVLCSRKRIISIQFSFNDNFSATSPLVKSL